MRFAAVASAGCGSGDRALAPVDMRDARPQGCARRLPAMVIGVGSSDGPSRATTGRPSAAPPAGCGAVVTSGAAAVLVAVVAPSWVAAGAAAGLTPTPMAAVALAGLSGNSELASRAENRKLSCPEYPNRGR